MELFNRVLKYLSQFSLSKYFLTSGGGFILLRELRKVDLGMAELDILYKITIENGKMMIERVKCYKDDTHCNLCYNDCEFKKSLKQVTPTKFLCYMLSLI